MYPCMIGVCEWSESLAIDAVITSGGFIRMQTELLAGSLICRVNIILC